MYIALFEQQSNHNSYKLKFLFRREENNERSDSGKSIASKVHNRYYGHRVLSHQASLKGAFSFLVGGRRKTGWENSKAHRSQWPEQQWLNAHENTEWSRKRTRFQWMFFNTYQKCPFRALMSQISFDKSIDLHKANFFFLIFQIHYFLLKN